MLKINKIVFFSILTLLASNCMAVKKVDIVHDKKKALHLLQQMSSDYSLQLDTRTQLPSGVRYKFVQFYKGKQVLNTKIISKKESLSEMNEGDLVAGEFFIDVEHDVITNFPVIDLGTAIGIATVAHKDNSSEIKNINSSLMIKAYAETAKLIYVIDYFVDITIPKRPFFIIDAQSGIIHEDWDGLPT